jgi:hypothetical protein
MRADARGVARVHRARAAAVVATFGLRLRGETAPPHSSVISDLGCLAPIASATDPGTSGGGLTKGSVGGIGTIGVLGASF